MCASRWPINAGDCRRAGPKSSFCRSRNGATIVPASAWASRSAVALSTRSAGRWKCGTCPAPAAYSRSTYLGAERARSWGPRGGRNPVANGAEHTMASKPTRSRVVKPPSPNYQLWLYVAGRSGRSIAATSNLKRICEVHLAGRYAIEVIDLLEQPQLAKADEILA